MEAKLLGALSCSCIPNNCGSINLQMKKVFKTIESMSIAQVLAYPCGENVIPTFVPFERKNGSFVLTQCAGQTSIGRPDTSVSIVATSRQ